MQQPQPIKKPTKHQEKNQKGKEIVKKSFDNIIDRMDVNTESIE